MDEEREVGERGPDKEPRNFNPKSLFNLKQFQKPVPESTASVNAGISLSKIGIILASAIAVFAVWKIWNKKSEDMK